MIQRTLSLAVVLALAGCGSGSETPSAAPDETVENELAARLSAAKVVVDANGLATGQGRSREAPRFGSPRGEVDALLTRAFGSEPERTTNNECGAGPTDFSQAGPLQVAYQDNRFVGWFAGDGEGVVTADGIRTGVELAALRNERPVEVIVDSTLDGEFQYQSADYGMITGFFQGDEADGRVTALAAGVTCFFR